MLALRSCNALVHCIRVYMVSARPNLVNENESRTNCE